MNKSGRELPLLRKVGNSLELNYDVLLSVLTHRCIGDRPISIVSIAGALRTGKSFMLNLFLRYLQNKGYEHPNDWLGDSSIPLKDGIQWRGGSQPNTCGINIWSEPFIVKKDGKEIAVILLDTQGNDDYADSRKNTAKVFVISALLSSTFIFNVKERINHHDLEYLQFFIEFARAKKESERTESNFQSLEFLVRDWENESEYSLGPRGGEDYLKSVLDKEDESSLIKYFETVNCYLMPNPGKRVRQANHESSVNLADIKPQFREHISPLTECLLNPKTLIVKKIGSDDINGRWLTGYIADCVEKLNAAGLQTSVTMMELMAQAKCKEFIEKGKENCREIIKKMHKSYVPDERIQEIKQKAMDAALKLYDENVNYGEENIIQKYRVMLEDSIKQQFKTLHITNQSCKLDPEARLQSAVTTCLDNYTKGILALTDGKWTNKLKKFHETNFIEAMMTFIVVSAKIACERMVNSYSGILVTKLNRIYKGFGKDNEKYEEDAKHSFEILLFKAIAEHRNCMEEAINTGSVSIGDFITLHEKGIEQAILRFSTCCDIVCPGSIKVEYSMEKLFREIEKNKQLLWHKNESLEEAEDNATFKRAKEGIDNLMKKEFYGKITKESTIKQKCEEFSMKVLKSLQPGKSFMPKWEKEAKRIAQSCLEENKYLQDSTKHNLHEEKTRIEIEFQRICEEKLSVDGIYVEENELQQYIDSKIIDLIETSLAQEKVATVEMKEEFRQDVEKLLKEKAEEIAGKNVENKISYHLRLKQQLEKFEKNYISTMEQKLNEAYIEPDVLDRFHKEVMKDVSNILQEQRRNLAVFTGHEKRVKKELTSLYEAIKEWNEENKPLRRKEISAFAGGRIVGGLGNSAAIGPLPLPLPGIIAGFGAPSTMNIRKRGLISWGYSGSGSRYDKNKTEKNNLKREAAEGVSFGEIDSTGGVMRCNDCVIEVPPKAVTEGEKIHLDLSTSFQSKQCQKTYLAITPLFRCDPAVPEFLKEVVIELPTWCSTTSKDIIVYVKENNEGESFREREIKFEDDYVIQFKISHFNDFCCFVKSSLIGLCSISLSLKVFMHDEHDVIFVFHLADTTVQNACEIELLKSGLLPIFAGIERFPVKHGESAKLSLCSLGNAMMDAAYSMDVVVDNEFICKGYTWKKFCLPNLQITENMKLTYILNGEKKYTEIQSINFQNSDETIEDDLAIN